MTGRELLQRGALSVVGLALLTSGCGGDEGSLTADEFRDRAEGICREIEETEVRPPSDAGDVDRYANEFVEVFEASANDLRELNPPDEFSERWDEYLDLVDDAMAMVHAFRDEVDDATPEEIAQLAQEFSVDFEDIERRGHEIEGELGLDECID
jgi:hypothetical protein